MRIPVTEAMVQGTALRKRDAAPGGGDMWAGPPAPALHSTTAGSHGSYVRIARTFARAV